MNSTRRLELVLRALTVAFVLVGGAALVRPPAIPEGQRPPADLTTDPGLAPAAAPFADIMPDVEAVLDANIFSTTRTRPRNRYDPFGSVPSDPPAMNPSSFEPDAIPETPPADAVPRFFGTVVGPGGSSALLRLDPATPDARLYREGDSGGRYRVVRIESQSVTLMGPNGSITLRLPPPPGDG